MTEYDKNIKHCFIDSNIWLYALIESQDKNKSNIAKEIIIKNKKSIIISTQVINEICVNLIKKANFSEGEIRKLIISFYNKFRIFEMNKAVILKASAVRENNCFSFWDSLVVASSLITGCEILFSEDMQNNFVIENTRIVNPLQGSFKT